MRILLAATAALGLTMAATTAAHADPGPPDPRCTTAQLTLDVQATVCLGVVGQYPPGSWQAWGYLKNTGTTRYEGFLRTDLVWPTDTVYGQPCSKQLPAGATMDCYGKLDGRFSSVAPQGRALVMRPGYQEYLTVHWY